MAIPSNLYAEKIFAEHPIALWALDEPVDYLSLIDESDRDFSTWSKSSNSITLSNIDRIDEPFSNAPTTEVFVNSSVLNEITLTGNNLFSSFRLNQNLETFSIGSYFYSLAPSITGVSIGYTYPGLESPILKNVNTRAANRWFFVSETFDIPDTNQEISIVIKIKYAVISEIDEYKFLLNGITAGQWSENFNTSSLGVESVEQINTNIAVLSESDLQAIPAKAYGISSLDGYYLLKNNELLARNTGVPMVYGAENVTAISPNDDLPSLIIPGLGFLNESGKFKEYTAEFWIRINSDSLEKRKIFGPIASDDGLYVDGPFLTLQIGQYSGSHFITEWFRPMLIDIRFILGSASLMINGERVISFEIDNTKLELAPFLSQDKKEQDWLGFYAYQDVSPINVDCFAIYPYSVPELVAKRRFVYGQGVEYPENINTAYNGTSVYIDYQFANYANNYSYPDIGRWNQGAIENLFVSNNALSLPSYPAPQIITENGASQDLLSDQFENFFSFYPNSNWEGIESYLTFEKIDFLKTRVESLYGIFQAQHSVIDKQQIFTILDPTTRNYFSVYIENSKINYEFFSNGALTTIEPEGYEASVSAGENFRVGILFKKIAEYIGKSAAAFFNNVNRHQIYIGGAKEFENTFKGKIYNVSFANERTLDSLLSLFHDSGVMNNYENVFFEYFDESLTPVIYDGGSPTTETWEQELNSSNEYNPESFKSVGLQSFIPTYSFLPRTTNQKFELNLAASGSWQDYVPLSYFAKYVSNTRGERIYALDFIQANISYPYTNNFKEVDGVKYFNTSKSLLKSYVSFHDNSSNTVISRNSRSLVLLQENKIIKPSSNWRSERYEFVDGAVIYMPENIDFNRVSISVQLEIQNDATQSKPFTLKQLHLGSLSLSPSVPTKIGTKFGAEMYPYRKRGLYYTDYKKENPFEIYKESAPYLYLTKKSGIRLIDNDVSYEDKGFQIPINAGLADSFKMIAFQSSVFYTGQQFSNEPLKVFEVRANEALVKVYMVAAQENGQRARFYAINGYTGGTARGVTFYINGKATASPSINVNEWAVLGINFGNILDFSNYLGQIGISGPLLVNNLSYYQLDDLQVIKRPVNRFWTEVRTTGEEVLSWAYWDPEKDLDPAPFSLGNSWGDILIVSAENQFQINGKDIYNSYAGTNKIIVDDTQIGVNIYNTNKLNLNNYEYNVITGALLESQTLKAV